MKNILVAIDLDDNADQLVGKASEFAKAFGSKIWLMHVAAPEPDFVGYAVGPQYIRDSLAEELRDEHRALQVFAEGLNKEGIEAEGLLIQGATVKMILQESVELQVEMIITGHHERGFLYKWFADPVSEALIDKSKIPVLIVPFQ